MIVHIHYDINAICKKILQEQLDKLDLKYTLISMVEVEINEAVSEEKLHELNAALELCSIEVVESQKSILVQKIKDAIVEMVFSDDKLLLKTSSYLSEKLSQSYGHLSNLFSSVTYINIETFVQMQKTERAKQLLATTELTISEIGWKLNYSSTAHFSNQFKNVTGLTPSAFQRIIAKRRVLNMEEQ